MTTPEPPTDPATRSRIAAIVEDRRANLGPEPSIETLRAYLADELPAEEAERVQEHLATDPELTDLLLDLHDFEAAEPEVPRLSEADLDDRLRRFRERLGAEAPSQGGSRTETAASEGPASESRAPASRAEVRPFRRPSEPRPEPPRVRTWPAGVRLAAAAVLLVAVGLGGWLVGRLTTGQTAPTVIAEIDPEGSLRTRSGDLARIEVPPWAERMVLILPLAEPIAADHSGYRLEIVPLTRGGGPDGAAAPFSTRTAPADGELVSEFIQILPTDRFPPGIYRATLYGLEGNRETALESYRFRVAGAEGVAPER